MAVRRHLGCPLLVLALVTASPARAQQAPIHFDIAEQDLASALRVFARSAGAQVAFDTAAVQGRRNKRLAGTMTAEAAMRRLLAGTGLGFTRSAGDLFVILRPNQDLPPAAALPIGEDNPSQIVVTARKRAERALDVPVAISAVTGRTAEQRGARSTSDLLQEFAGVGIYDRGDGSQKITVRGVSTSLGANENGYYLDDLPITAVTVPYSPDVRAWDLDRVEVLRGPQGTLFGEGSLGGTVRILTRGADLAQWGAKGAAYLSQTQDGGTNRGIKAAINAPVVPGRLALRVAGTAERLDGWIDNPATGQKNVNDQTVTTFRAKARFDPTDRLSITASYWRYKGDFPAGTAEESDAGNVSRAILRSNALKYWLGGVSARYELGQAEAFYSYSRNTLDLSQDGDFLDARLLTRFTVDVEAHEARLASSRDGRFQWTVGAYLRDAVRKDIFQYAPLDIDNRGRVTSKARALFGEGSYRLGFAPIDVTAGLRYYHERLYGFETNSGIRTDQPGDVYESWNPRFSLSWHPREDATIYVSAAKGFRAGQLQPTIAKALATQLDIDLPAALSQDYIWTYELGVKAQLLDRLLTVEGAIFHSDWKNVAVRIPIGITGYNGLINSKGTRTDGVEASLFLRPSPDLTLSANAAYTDAVYAGDVPGTAIVDGAPVDDVARFTASAAADYRHDLTDGAAAFGRIVWQHSSRRNFVSFPAYRPGDRINRIDARLGIEMRKISLALFADNLTNERGAASFRTVQQIAPGDLDSTAVRLRPRTIGIELTMAVGSGM